MARSTSMQTRSLLPACLTAAAIFTAIACSDSTAPSLTSPSASASFQTEATADLAPSAGQDVANDFTFMSGADASGGGAIGVFGSVGTTSINGLVHASVMAPTTAQAAWISPSCSFSASTGRFDCPPVTRNNHIFTVSYALFDANGVVQSQFNKVTTASINFIVQDTGAVSFSSNGNTFADTSSRIKNATVTGLAGDPDTLHTWNGYGSGSIRSVRSGQISKVYELASTDTLSGVAFRQPRDINPYPLGGTIVRNYNVTRLREASDTTQRTASRRVVVTFNGTVNVPMTVTNGDGTVTNYMLNLDTHKVTKQ